VHCFCKNILTFQFIDGILLRIGKRNKILIKKEYRSAIASGFVWETPFVCEDGGCHTTGADCPKLASSRLSLWGLRSAKRAIGLGWSTVSPQRQLKQAGATIKRSKCWVKVPSGLYTAHVVQMGWLLRSRKFYWTLVTRIGNKR
jgi:hypothetical protein